MQGLGRSGILWFLLFFTSSLAQSFPKTVGEIPVPDSSWQRVHAGQGTFSFWLRNRTLKPPGSDVLNYRGQVHKKASDTTIAAVFQWPIKNRKMEQCMDILVRFFAEYQWDTGSRKQVAFPLPGGKFLTWDSWQLGWRPQFSGIKFDLYKKQPVDSSHDNFNRYLTMLFDRSHTQQFYHAYPKVPVKELAPGDFIVSRGNPAHAVMIVDLAENKHGDQIALIGHGDTPACEFHLLSHATGNPWFPVDFSREILPLPIRRKMKWSGLRRMGTGRDTVQK